MIRAVLGLVTGSRASRRRTQIYCECRRCGTAVSRDDEECPHCDCREIARLEL